MLATCQSRPVARPPVRPAGRSRRGPAAAPPGRLPGCRAALAAASPAGCRRGQDAVPRLRRRAACRRPRRRERRPVPARALAAAGEPSGGRVGGRSSRSLSAAGWRRGDGRGGPWPSATRDAETLPSAACRHARRAGEPVRQHRRSSADSPPCRAGRCSRSPSGGGPQAAAPRQAGRVGACPRVHRPRSSLQAATTGHRRRSADADARPGRAGTVLVRKVVRTSRRYTASRSELTGDTLGPACELARLSRRARPSDGPPGSRPGGHAATTPARATRPRSPRRLTYSPGQRTGACIGSASTLRLRPCARCFGLSLPPGRATLRGPRRPGPAATVADRAAHDRRGRYVLGRGAARRPRRCRCCAARPGAAALPAAAAAATRLAVQARRTLLAGCAVASRAGQSADQDRYAARRRSTTLPRSRRAGGSDVQGTSSCRPPRAGGGGARAGPAAAGSARRREWPQVQPSRVSSARPVVDGEQPPERPTPTAPSGCVTSNRSSPRICWSTRAAAVVDRALLRTAGARSEFKGTSVPAPSPASSSTSSPRGATLVAGRAQPRLLPRPRR